MGLGALVGSLGSPVAAITQPAAQPAAQPIAQPTCRVELGRQIEAITQQSGASWGILAQTLGEHPRRIYAQNADQMFIPASNVKLLTTAAALAKLGDGFRIRTSVYQMPGEIRVVGRGDPSLTDAQLRQLARQLAQHGIHQIDRLVADDQYFQGVFFNPTWEQEDIESGYGAPFNSLILNQNALGLTLIPQAIGQALALRWDDPTEATRWKIINRSQTVAPDAGEFLTVGRDLSQPILHLQGQLRAGSAPEPVAVSIPDPARYFLERFRRALEAEQIQVRQTKFAQLPLSGVSVGTNETAAVESAPLSELLIETNQQSNNLYAEAILRQLGTPSNSVDLKPASALQAGILGLQASLTQLGVTSRFRLADGSGLSRQNLASPEVFVETLQAMSRSQYAERYQASLSVAGINGTLASRFKQTSVQGQFRGKTGSLRGVAALSGYLQVPEKSALAVSILVNAPKPLQAIQPKIDAIIRLLHRQGSC
jgi:serine-type D-Ala-D-Ala carboxypeptidase/endopeptidase (penicillin-binding protein 4)